MEGVIAHKGRRYWVLRVSALYAGEEARIDWASLLPSAAGTRGRRSGLITACKALLEAMTTMPRRSTVALSHATVSNIFGQIKGLARWMAERDKWRFSGLTPQDVTTYLHEMKPREGSRGVVTSNTLQQHIYVLRCLWDFRSDLPDGLTFDIRRIESDVLGAMRLRPLDPWRPINEPDAIKLLQAAKLWTDAHAVYIGALLERLWGEHRAVVGVTRSRAKRRRTAFYQALGEEANFQRLANDLRMADRMPYTVLRAAVRVLEGAILTSVLLLVGLRAREFVRLDADCVLPAGDGDPDDLLLAGVAAKKGGRRRTWAITEDVGDAIEAMRIMLRAPRHASKQPSLMLDGAAARCALFPGSRLPHRSNPSTVTMRMRSFVAAAFPGEPSLLRSAHAHAARKTFARFVVMRDKRVLESLAYHFGHTHRAITDGYYVGADIELALLLDAENRQDLAQSLADLLSSRNIAGKAAKAFASTRKAAAGMRGKATLQSVVDRLIADGVQLAPCDWGYCVYSKSLSACLGDAKGPNESLRTAEVCNGCSNFVVTERHRAWWEERVVRDSEFLKGHDLSMQSVVVVQRRLARSGELLAELNAGRVIVAAGTEQGGGE